MFGKKHDPTPPNAHEMVELRKKAIRGFKERGLDPREFMSDLADKSLFAEVDKEDATWWRRLLG